MSSVVLSNCSPLPLAYYLKALGCFRIAVEQFDSLATGWWSRDTFVLDTTFDRDQLLECFLERYEPTPILAPWNGGSGFHTKDNKEAITTIEGSKSQRFSRFRESISFARSALKSVGLKEKPSQQEKEQLLRLCRGSLPDNALNWLDAAFVLTDDGPKYPPLLGTGGNDGRLEFTNNFMQRLIELISPETGASTAQSKDWLNSSLFGSTIAVPASKAPVGQFLPGAAGGPNTTSGFGSESAVNPWDFVLMLEGAILFAAAAVRRLEGTEPGALAYPFCVRPAAVGYGSASPADEENSRAEMWLPLWSRPVGLAELTTLLSEGRAQLGQRAARNGVDFARAVVTLGVDRGLSSFQRYGFQVRNGLSYFATPLDRVVVRRNASADLLSDPEVDRWLARFRDKAGPSAKQVPAPISRALNQLERSVLGLCKHADPAKLQAVLIALGHAEATVARSPRWRKEAGLPPLSGLSPDWLRKADTGSSEFRLAASLSSLSGKFGDAWLPLRCQLEPVESAKGGLFKWAEAPSNDRQWSESRLANALNAVFARRIIRAEQTATGGLPDAAVRVADFEDITRFIECRTDDRLLSALIWGLGLLDWSKVDPVVSPSRPDFTPHPLYTLLKLCFLPTRQGQETIPLVPAIHRLAAVGNGSAASSLAARRLRASGLPTALREINIGGETVSRVAAALIFPLSWQDEQWFRDNQRNPVLLKPKQNG